MTIERRLGEPIKYCAVDLEKYQISKYMRKVVYKKNTVGIFKEFIFNNDIGPSKFVILAPLSQRE